MSYAFTLSINLPKTLFHFGYQWVVAHVIRKVRCVRQCGKRGMGGVLLSCNLSFPSTHKINSVYLFPGEEAAAAVAAVALTRRYDRNLEYPTLKTS